MKTKITARICTAGALFLAASSPGRAEDVEKKFRISFAAGGYDTQDKVQSDSANFLTLIKPDGTVGDRFEDPRSDDAAIGKFGIQPATRYSLSGQYAFTKIFILEGSVGYQNGDVGKVEVQGQFDADHFDDTRRHFNYRVFRMDAGTLTQVPLQVTALARFRPKATFNPYLGAGAGFTFIGFEPSPELNQLSINMDRAKGDFAQLAAFPGVLNRSGTFTDLSGARVEARDTFEWHLAGGTEFGFGKKWSAFIDLRYTFASRKFRLGFNGGDSLGISVPEGEQDEDSIFGHTAYGTFHVGDLPPRDPSQPPTLSAPGEGLLDAGCPVPVSAVTPQPCTPPGAVLPCDPYADFDSPTACKLQIGTPDGILDPGFYYVKGGSIKYGGASLQVGIRFTF